LKLVLHQEEAMENSQRLPSDHSEIDESFSDVFETHLTDWSYAITFGLRSVRSDEPHKYNNQVRMPLAQAKALAVLMLRNIRRYKQAAEIDIDLPRDVLEKLQIPQEDWQLFRDAS
jgi:hypothetical protein